MIDGHLVLALEPGPGGGAPGSALATVVTWHRPVAGAGPVPARPAIEVVEASHDGLSWRVVVGGGDGSRPPSP